MSIAIIGLSIGAMLFLLAAGLTIVFGVLGVINFAHGAYFMLGAYLAHQSLTTFGSLWPAFGMAVLVAGIVGALQEVVTLRSLYDRAHAFQLLSTFGVALVIEAAIRLIWGYDYKTVNIPGIFSTPVSLLGIDMSLYRLFTIAFGAAVWASLHLWLTRSSAGLVIRAAATNPDMVGCLGLGVGHLRTAVVAGSAALAALGGVIAAPMVPVELGMGQTIIIDCFIVVILGGLGNINGALLAALLLGQFQAFGQTYFPEWVQSGVYIGVAAALLVRPNGIFALKGRTA